MTSSPGVARRAWVSRTLMRSGDREVTSAAICQGPVARASMDKKTPKKNRHSESVLWGGGLDGRCLAAQEVQIPFVVHPGCTRKRHLRHSVLREDTFCPRARQVHTKQCTFDPTMVMHASSTTSCYLLHECLVPQMFAPQHAHCTRTRKKGLRGWRVRAMEAGQPARLH